MKTVTTYTQDKTGIPPKVESAMQFIQYCERITNPPKESSMWSGTSEPRKLTMLEGRVRDAAMMALLEYFNAGMDNSEPTATKCNPDEPEQTITQPA